MADSILESVLCSMCHDFRGIGEYITGPPMSRKRKYRHHFKLGVHWNDLEKSAASCEICGILVSGCRGCFQQRGVAESQISHCDIDFYYAANEEEEADVDKQIFFSMKDGSWFTVQIFAGPDDDQPVLDTWESVPVWWRTSPRTDSDEAFETAQSWLEQCHSASHKNCRTPESPMLPTRVVDVGSQDAVVRVVEPAGARGKYISLSHCWGAEQILTTRKANIQDHMREISMDSLPKTFRDAVQITRRFGIAYLWIDSLCILQDDEDDWRIESARMQSVYRKAHLTIAATRSHNATAGLFTATPDFEVSGVSSSGKRYSLFFREKIDHHLENSRPMSINGHHVSRSTGERHPLLTRAWVFQERLLSTRVLHFGPYELFFECRTSIECECDGIAYQGSSETQPTVAMKSLYDDAIANHKAYISAGARVQLQEDWISRLWRTMVSAYTALQITKPHDRLPGIGGLAKSIRKKKASAYLAGLWQSSLNDDLLWVIQVKSSEKQPRPQPRTAPTWSWASVNIFCRYFDEILFWHPEIWLLEHQGQSHTSHHLARVESCRVDRDGPDEFGLIAGGILQVSGTVSEGTLEREVESHQEESNVVHYVSIAGRRFPLKSDYLLDHEGPGRVIPGTKVYCLRMSTIQEGGSEYMISLVLRVSLVNPSTFERIGTLVVYAKPPPVDVNSGIYESAAVRTVMIA